jgi:hypothetical protein
MAHGHDHLDDAGDASGTLGVTDVRLQRAQQHRLLTIAAVGRQQGLRLDRVTQPRPGPVSFHDVDIGGAQPRTGQCLADHPLLRQAVGRRQAVRRTILVHRRTANHGQHRVTVAFGIRKAFQHQHSDAFTPGGAVR